MAPDTRQKVVVVGLGMVGISFIEKLLKLDARTHEYDVVVLGEETHLAYNRVGLTTYFGHRQAEKLYLNPREWYDTAVADGTLRYHTDCRVANIDPNTQSVTCENGRVESYDFLVLATGSDAVRPTYTPGHDAQGVFVYRNIDDLDQLMAYAEGLGESKKTAPNESQPTAEASCRPKKVGAVVGGGLLGLEAAKAMLDLGKFDKVAVIERNRWVLSRQLDAEAGGMVVGSVRELGVDVHLTKRVKTVDTNDKGAITGVQFEDGESMECATLCFAIGVRPRDALAKAAGLRCAEKGGGIAVGDDLQTSVPNIYAIGECASWRGQSYGLIAPGVEMADVLAFNLTQAKLHRPRTYRSPDLSTRLKLLGVEVASFGDYFADRDGPTSLPPKVKAKLKKQPPSGTAAAASSVRALTYKDPFRNVYKKYIFTDDGKYLLGGMMIGDTRDYVKLVPMVKKHKELDKPPSELILGAQKEGDEGGDDLDDDTQVCSCHNVSKGAVVEAVRDGGCHSLGEVKACTKAGTGCGGCMPLITAIFNQAMVAAGNEVTNHLCPHFTHSRADLYNIIAVRELTTFAAVMRAAGVRPDSVGCEVCKPAVASILASLWNRHVMAPAAHSLQDTNDRFLGNMQRDGTFSVVPRVSAGEITPERLMVLGQVAADYGLYTKITGGQRIDLFGAKKQDLPAIWARLVDAGMESGHAYAKALRTVKSCVGTTWCRYGVGDSVGMAVRLEERYKSIRSPHKIKGGVSGCVRECAEAQGKDFGLIATEKGFNIFVGGNGGATPRHAELLARDVPPADVVPILDRFLAFYIRTADKLQRTARWIEGLPGGVSYLRDVVVHDKLGLAAALEAQMQHLVDSYFDEWAEAVKDPALRARFQQFANTPETLSGEAEREVERQQTRPAYAPADPVKPAVDEADDALIASAPSVPSPPSSATLQRGHFQSLNGRWSSLAWQPVLATGYFDKLAGTEAAPGPDRPADGDHSHSLAVAAAVKLGDTQLAVFRVHGRYYATQQMCPHKRAFVLSDGLVGEVDAAGDADDEHAHPWVSCPLHKRNFDLVTGLCRSDPLSGLSLATFAAEVRTTSTPGEATGGDGQRETATMQGEMEESTAGGDAAGNKILYGSSPGSLPGSLSSSPSGSSSSTAVSSVSTPSASSSESSMIYLLLPPPAELDAALGTARWRLRAGAAAGPDSDAFAALDRKLRFVGQRAKRPGVRPLDGQTAGGAMMMMHGGPTGADGGGGNMVLAGGPGGGGGSGGLDW